MQCGVFWFLHIGKAGGSTVEHRLNELQESPKGKAEGWHNDRLPMTPVNGRDTGKWHTYYSYEGWNNSRQWQSLLREVYTAKQPRFIMSAHHGTPGMGDYLLENEMPRLRKALEAKGCRLVLATTLREPVARTISSAQHMSRIGRAGMSQRDLPAFLDRGESNFQVRYVMSTKSWLPLSDIATDDDDDDSDDGKYVWSESDDHSQLAPAIRTLEQFDLVGRTEELADFIGWCETILNLTEPFSRGGAKQMVVPHTAVVEARNSADEGDNSDKFCISKDEMELLQKRNTVDLALYTHFCAAPKGVGQDEKVAALEQELAAVKAAQQAEKMEIDAMKKQLQSLLSKG